MPAGILERFLGHARRTPDAPAVVEYSRTWSFADVLNAATGAAEMLRRNGVGRGDTVCVRATNGVSFHVLDLAALLAGGVPAFLPEHLTCAEAASMLRALRPPHVVDSLPGTGNVLERSCRDNGIGYSVFTPSDLTSTTAEPEAVEVLGRAAGGSERYACVVFTSGTTGELRGVLLRDRDVTAGLEAWTGTWPLSTLHGRRALSYLPISHVAERMMSHYLMCLFGVTVCVAPAGTVERDLCWWRPDIVLGVPHVWRSVARGARATDDAGTELRRALAGVGVAVNGAAPLGSRTAGILVGTGVPLLDAYGMTETTVPAFSGPVRAADSVLGTAVGVRHRIGPGGELLIRSPYAAAGYVTRWPDTVPVTDDEGWLHTGDRAEVDAGGLRVTGRVATTIKTARGQLISPGPVEEYLRDLPDVADACVTGHGRPYAVALVSAPDARGWSAGVTRERERDLLEALRMARRRGDLPYADIGAALIVPDAWTVASGLTTRTGKVRRSMVEHRYADLLLAVYENGAGGE